MVQPCGNLRKAAMGLVRLWSEVSHWCVSPLLSVTVSHPQYASGACVASFYRLYLLSLTISLSSTLCTLLRRQLLVPQPLTLHVGRPLFARTTRLSLYALSLATPTPTNLHNPTFTCAVM